MRSARLWSSIKRQTKFTESGIVKLVASGSDTGTVQVKTFLSQPIISVSSSEEIHRAAALMKEYSVQRLAVIDDGELTGILTTSDLTDYIPRLRNTIRRNERQAAKRSP